MSRSSTADAMAAAEKRISRESFAIAALEVTLGPLEDLRSGRRTVHAWAVQPGEDGATVLIPRSEWEDQDQTGEEVQR